MAKDDRVWFELKAPPGKHPRVKRAHRLFAFDDHEVWLPAVAFGATQEEAFLCASYDGVTVVGEKDTLYFPLSWLRKEWPSPQNEEIAANIEDHVARLRQEVAAGLHPEPADD